ncbi:MAG: pseudouridine-5'-phosphate glycosidase [Planctomycetota bacterium]
MAAPGPGPVVVLPEVEQALRDARPVVALETAVLTCGLPARPFDRTPAAAPDDLDASAPVNLEAARLMERRVRSAGAVPATVAVLDGALRVGLAGRDLERLAEEAAGRKTGVADLAPVLRGGGSAGTTVSATLLACGLARPGPIELLATGGIGGVHRGWTARPDVSADLRQLAESRVCTVCSGAKSVLDVPATVEWLAALGVTVIGYRTDRLPQFLATSPDAPPVPARLDTPREVAETCRLQWDGLGRRSAVLVANPVPPEAAVDAAELDRVVAEACAEADRRQVTGGDLTPFLLDQVAGATGERSIGTNLALLTANAQLAGRVAVALHDVRARSDG